MGICLCERHGRAGIVVVCPHVSELVSRGRYGRFHRLRVLGEDIFCGDCFHATGLDDTAREVDDTGAAHLADAAIETYLRAIERLGQRTTAHCAECVAAAEVTQARIDGRPDPFPVYERTMTSHHAGALSELYAYLVDELAFRESIAPRPDVDAVDTVEAVEAGATSAVAVVAGTYRKPLTVRAYYVVEAAAQDRIVGLVSGFLAGRELDQARVEFYEAEIWETDGLGLRYRGEERLLRDALLNC